MAKGERQNDGTRGGVGTITRPGSGRPGRPGRPARPVPAQRPIVDPGQAGPGQAGTGQAGTGQEDPGQAGPRRAGGVGVPWRVPPAEQTTGLRPEQGPRSPQASPGARPRPRPRPQQSQPQLQPQLQPQQPRHRPQPRELGLPGVIGAHRMPFVLLLCGLLGGALVSALVISTTLAEGSFEITKLQSSTSSLARERQTLEDQVAQAQSAPVIAAKAAKLGMREVNELRFIDLKTGKITTDAGAVQSYIPGYMP